MKTLQVRNIKTILCAAVGTASHQHGLEANTVYADRTVCSCRYSKSSAGLEACTVYADRTVCSCRHSKSSAWVRSMYCVCRPYCVQLQAQQKSSAWVRSLYCVWRLYCVQLKAQQVIIIGQKHVLHMEMVLCAAVGTASQQHGLEAFTLCVRARMCMLSHSTTQVG